MNVNRQRFLPAFFLGLFLVPLAAPSRPAEFKWIRVSSSHFSVLTDSGQKKGVEVVVRLEQMRAIFAQLLLKNKLILGAPLDVLALNSDKEYVQAAPVRQGQPISAPGFFLPGERNYIVLDLAAEESWRAVSRQLALTWLYYNYPPTPGWFDEGFAEYFSSLRFDKQQAEIGGDPALTLSWHEDLLGNQKEVPNPPKSFTELLSGPVWLAVPDLFTMRHDPWGGSDVARHTLFHAESWIVMHYLLNKNKLPETGTYLDLVQNQKIPVEQAIQQAYGMTPAQFEQAVKDYFHSLSALFQAMDAARQPGAMDAGGRTFSFPSPIGPEDIGSSIKEVADPEAQALMAELQARLPEHRDAAMKELESLLSDPKTENPIAHRALAWAFMETQDFARAGEEIDQARELNDRDPWIRFYGALIKYRQAQPGEEFQGLANMIQDLRAVVDWDPDFAEAYNMLALARVEGGGINSALASIHAAVQLSPRNKSYLLNLAEIYMAGKKWDEATALLEDLRRSPDLQIAQAARKNLEELPAWRKYGIPPQTGPAAAAQPPPRKNTQPIVAKSAEEASAATGADTAPAEPRLDTRKVQFLKGKLVRVDCGQTPVAVLTVSTGARTLKLRTENYKSLLVLGADQFSCEWKNRPVSLNYKAGGKADGDLVSVEMQ